jgi:polyhydroxyalkanoate synthesis regulator phasin
MSEEKDIEPNNVDNEPKSEIQRLCNAIVNYDTKIHTIESEINSADDQISLIREKINQLKNQISDFKEQRANAALTLQKILSPIITETRVSSITHNRPTRVGRKYMNNAGKDTIVYRNSKYKINIYKEIIDQIVAKGEITRQALIDLLMTHGYTLASAKTNICNSYVAYLCDNLHWSKNLYAAIENESGKRFFKYVSPNNVKVNLRTSSDTAKEQFLSKIIR